MSICVLAERYGVKGGLFVNNTRRKSVITGTGISSNMRMTTSFILKTLEKTFLWMKLA